MFWGVWYTVGEVFQDLSDGVLQAPKYLKYQLVSQEKTNLQLFCDCRAWWSKEQQWENDCGSFSHSFFTSVEVELFLVHSSHANSTSSHKTRGKVK